MKKLTLLAAGFAGYVLGSRAGRERYEQIKSGADRLWSSPGVQKQVDRAEDFIKDKTPEVVTLAADGVKKLAQAAGAASGKVSSRKAGGGKNSTTAKRASTPRDTPRASSDTSTS